MTKGATLKALAHVETLPTVHGRQYDEEYNLNAFVQKDQASDVAAHGRDFRQVCLQAQGSGFVHSFCPWLSVASVANQDVPASLKAHS